MKPSWVLDWLSVQSNKLLIQYDPDIWSVRSWGWTSLPPVLLWMEELVEQTLVLARKAPRGGDKVTCCWLRISWYVEVKHMKLFLVVWKYKVNALIWKWSDGSSVFGPDVPDWGASAKDQFTIRCTFMENECCGGLFSLTPFFFTSNVNYFFYLYPRVHSIRFYKQIYMYKYIFYI